MPGKKSVSWRLSNGRRRGAAKARVAFSAPPPQDRSIDARQFSPGFVKRSQQGNGKTKSSAPYRP